MSGWLSFGAAVLAAALALTGLDRLRFEPWHRFRQYWYERHFQARLAHGEDRYFEELRALQAYPPEGLRPLPPFWRTFALNLAWLALIALAVIVIRSFTE